MTEQVAHFEVTQYPVDGRGDAEIGFEEILAFDRRGGFTIKDNSTETRRKWLLRHRTLGGPKLLERNEKKIADDESDNDIEDGDADDAGENEDSNPASDVPSFRSDRRIVRWLIARCFAETIQQAYLKHLDIKRLFMRVLLQHLSFTCWLCSPFSIRHGSVLVVLLTVQC